MTERGGTGLDKAQALISLVSRAAIPVQAARVLEMSYFRPSSNVLLSAIGIGDRDFTGGTEPVAYFPVIGLLKALDLAARESKKGDKQINSDAAMLIGAVYNGSLPQFAVGEWQHPSEMYDAITTARTTEEAIQARRALESCIGLAALKHAVMLGGAELPDDDEETIESMTRVLQLNGMCNESGDVNVDLLLQADQWHQEKIESTLTGHLSTSR